MSQTKINCRITERSHKKIHEIAWKNKTSVSTIIRALIARVIDGKIDVRELVEESK